MLTPTFYKKHLIFDVAEQFDIYVFITGGNIRYFVFMVVAVFLIILFIYSLGVNSKLFVVAEFFLNLVKLTVENNMSSKNFNYSAYLPIFYIMFFLILFFNITGLIPFTYTITSLLVVPFFLSGINFFFTTFLGFRKYGLTFFGGFLPADTNIFIAPLLILIEIVSYLVKVLSLAVRLFANMFAGHVLVKVLLSLCWALLLKIAVLPLILAILLSFLILAILSLELFICFLQAYVFINLASIYLDQVVGFLNH